MDSSYFSIVFPNFEADGGEIHPDSETTDYNCIAWAVNQTDRPWWPGAGDDAYWPEGAPIEETAEAFIAMFVMLGFEPCETEYGEAGHEKVALYSLKGKPTHAARQKPDGKWSSKLGKDALVTHNSPRGVKGPVYGAVGCYLRRRVQPTDS